MAESIKDYFEKAKYIAKVEKDSDIEQWVEISLIRQIDGNPQNIETLKVYDIPRRIQERWEWVFRWRRARYQCRYPRDIITQGCCFYRKVKGYDIGMQKELSKFVSAKAQVSRQEHIVEEYRRQRQSENDLFYSEADDAELQHVLEKLKQKRQCVLAAEERLKAKVKEYETNRKQNL